MQKQVYIIIIIFIVTREAYTRGIAGPPSGCKVREWMAVAVGAGQCVSGQKKIGVDEEQRT